MHVCLPSEDLAMVTHNTTIKLLFILFAVSIITVRHHHHQTIYSVCVCVWWGGGGGGD